MPAHWRSPANRRAGWAIRRRGAAAPSTPSKRGRSNRLQGQYRMRRDCPQTGRAPLPCGRQPPGQLRRRPREGPALRSAPAATVRGPAHQRPLDHGHQFDASAAPMAPRPPVPRHRPAPRRAQVSVQRHRQHGGRPVIQGMRQRQRRLDPFEAVLRQRETGERGGTHRPRMHGGAHVVHESRQCQLGRARPAADGRLRFEHRGAQPGLRQNDGGGQPVRPGPDHASGVVTGGNIPPPCPWKPPGNTCPSASGSTSARSRPVPRDW